MLAFYYFYYHISLVKCKVHLSGLSISESILLRVSVRLFGNRPRVQVPIPPRRVVFYLNPLPGAQAIIYSAP